MDINKISSKYEIRKLEKSDIDTIFDLYRTNTKYYEYLQQNATKEDVLEDMEGLPPNKNLSDKIFVGYFSNDKLIAVVDLIIGYPTEKIVFIGLFMLHKDYHGSGIGSELLGELLCFLKDNGLIRARLAYVKGNIVSKNFWLKNGFIELEEKDNGKHIVILMEKDLI